uniref:J domain-containing protein n=1 Tax=Kalanchoe fedtschenkoi TaxID=63787 RepID=A0A7N0RDT4_KALFE
MSDTCTFERSVETSESYFKLNQFTNAIRAMKAAKKRSPELSPAADRYLAAYKVHYAVRAEASWYKLLGIEYTNASPDDIKKQYKKMALALHPDKNGSAAAEGAFKYVSNAYEVLSDEAKRQAYNRQMGFRARPSKPKKQPKAPQAKKERQPAGSGPSHSSQGGGKRRGGGGQTGRGGYSGWAWWDDRWHSMWSSDF